MKTKVIDNFLPQEEFENIKNMIAYNTKFPFYHQSYVSHDPRIVFDENTIQPWNWYLIHLFYNYDAPISTYCQHIVETFVPKFQELEIFKSMIRIKANLYPYTEIIREHSPHVDYSFSHHSAIYSINTCDGFTKLDDGTKIDSVENRILFFDGNNLHNSSTTSNAMGRYNINFNFL